MDLFFRPSIPAFDCKDSSFHLACSFLLGLVFGGCISCLTSDSFLTLMRAADFHCMSIVSLLSVLLLPYLFSAFAVYIHQSWLLIPISFLKAFFFAYLYVGLTLSFGSAGWLTRNLLMFSDIFTLPVLWWLWLNLDSGKNTSFPRIITASVSAASAVGCFDFLIVAPYAAQLIT